MGSVLLQRDGPIATVILANSGKLNAIDIAMWRGLASTFRTLSQDESLRCVIVRGEGNNFAAGADIAEFPAQRNSTGQGLTYHNDIIGPALDAMTNGLHPTIAAIDGVCVGGGLEIACACDLRIAAPSSRFGIPIRRLGFALAPTEMQSLLQLIGLAATLEILLEGRVFDASEAMQKGLLHRIVDDVHDEAHQTAERIAAGAPLAARINRKLARRLSPLPDTLSLQERTEAYKLLDSNDYHEGIGAFLDRRKPSFTGN
ncbi:MAG: enoyl-CoA hydratase-related protein [Burkholderiaceae bacterium]|nr:enoyl-CoA hydratase-related protein [Burkholderiaceae bacterium]